MKRIIIKLMAIVLVLVPLNTNATTYVSTVTSNLNYGAKGNQVRYLQKELDQVMGCKLPTTGNYYSQTKTCVESFQRYYGLQVTGNVNAETRNLLNARYKLKKVIVSSSSVRVRSSKTTSTSSNILGKYYRGDRVIVFGTETGGGRVWYRLSYKGQTAYIASTEVKPTFIEVDITAQTLRLYKNTELYLDTQITTGKEGVKNTVTGYYWVVNKTYYSRYKEDGVTRHYQYWLGYDFYTGQGIHDAYWRNVGGKYGESMNFTFFGGTVYKTPGYNPGNQHTGSNGCINIPEARMPYIYNTAIATTDQDNYTEQRGTTPIYIYK